MGDTRSRQEKHAISTQSFNKRAEEKRPLQRSTHSLEDNIKTNLKYRGRDDVDWVYLSQEMARGRPL